MQHRPAAVVAEVDVVEFHFAVDIVQRNRPLWILVFGPLVQNFLGAFQSGESFRDLGPDIDDLNDGGDQKSQKKRVGKKAADGQGARHDLVRAHVHDDRSHHSHEQAGGKAHHGSGGQGFHHIVEQAPHAAGEDCFLAFLRMISLDHAHSAQ